MNDDVKNKEYEHDLILQRENVKKIEFDITKHFNEELDILRKIYEISEKIEKQHHALFKCLSNLKMLNDDEEYNPEKIALNEKIKKIKDEVNN